MAEPISEMPGLSPELTAKANRVFNLTKGPAREMKPEPFASTGEMIPLMKGARDKAAKEGDVDKAAAIHRNMQKVRKELKRES